MCMIMKINKNFPFFTEVQIQKKIKMNAFSKVPLFLVSGQWKKSLKNSFQKA